MKQTLEMRFGQQQSGEPTVVRNAALVTCNVVELNMVMKQLIELMIHSIDYAHLSPSAGQLNINTELNSSMKLC